MKVSIGIAAKELGVSSKTLRRLEAEEFSVEVVIINQSERQLSFEEKLAQDVLEIITVFSARLYGSRSHKNREMIETLNETVGKP